MKAVVILKTVLWLLIYWKRSKTKIWLCLNSIQDVTTEMPTSSSQVIRARLKFLFKMLWPSEQWNQEIWQVKGKGKRAVLSDLSFRLTIQNWENTEEYRFLSLLIYGRSNATRLNSACSSCTIRRGINHPRLFRCFWFCSTCRFPASWSCPWTLENIYPMEGDSGFWGCMIFAKLQLLCFSSSLLVCSLWLQPHSATPYSWICYSVVSRSVMFICYITKGLCRLIVNFWGNNLNLQQWSE